jgi:hypothetical protein
VQIDVGQRTGARADAARLRPQHAVAGHRQAQGDRIEIGGAAAERRQQHDGGPLPLPENFDLHVATRDDDLGCHVHRRSLDVL